MNSQESEIASCVIILSIQAFKHPYLLKSYNIHYTIEQFNSLVSLFYFFR